MGFFICEVMPALLAIVVLNEVLVCCRIVIDDDTVIPRATASSRPLNGHAPAVADRRERSRVNRGNLCKLFLRLDGER